MRHGNSARAQELAFIAGLSNRSDELLEMIIENHRGGSASVNGVQFEWGKVSRLIEGTDLSARSEEAQTVIRRLNIEPTHVSHLDHLPKTRKLQLEAEFRLPAGSISGDLSSTKADIFIRCKSGTPYFISLKEIDRVSKLAQVSRRTEYGNAVLDGGLESVEIPSSAIPKTFSWGDTGLKESQFKKITPKDRRLAFFKNNFPNEWSRMVESGYDEAKRQVQTFCSVLKSDRGSLLSFLRTTLAGSLGRSPNFFVVMGKEAVYLESTLNKLNDPRWAFSFEDASTQKKFAMKIFLTQGHNEPYCIARIEPTFEGKGIRVSQTKGIIFQFQQYPDTADSTARHYKRLLLDIRN
jgi:hypothetical protein